LQKDLGPALLLCCVFLAMYAIARGRLAMPIAGFALLVAGFSLGHLLHVSRTLSERVLMWQSPWSNSAGGGDQVAQAIWAMASGGTLGTGLGLGDSRYLPAGHTDLVLAALGEPAGGPAQGQGTMNNLTLGNESFTYYETTGGGQGACADADGPDAVHVAMSNTLNTPIEALETELPLRVRELSIRRETGGDGQRRGGDGVARELEALEPMRYTLITERRRHAPRGRAGGGDGEPGRNLLNGDAIPAKTSGELEPGDRLRIETPGGGGHGGE
jgi:hypothetical protein